MDPKAEHERLYSKIPSFKCKQGCTDCCGQISFSRWEWEQVKNKRKATSIHCPYSFHGKCDIYEQRPMICRLYGTVDTPMLTCPHGCGPLWKLTDEKAKEIMKEYFEIEDKGEAAK